MGEADARSRDAHAAPAEFEAFLPMVPLGYAWTTVFDEALLISTISFESPATHRSSYDFHDPLNPWCGPRPLLTSVLYQSCTPTEPDFAILIPTLALCVPSSQHPQADHLKNVYHPSDGVLMLSEVAIRRRSYAARIWGIV